MQKQVKQTDFGTQQRVLLVFEYLVTHGPMTLESLAAELPVPQSAIYRALQHLMQVGWVQHSAGRAGYVAGQKVRGLLDQGHFGFPYPNSARRLITQSGISTRCYFDFVSVNPDGIISMTDSTDLSATCFEPLSIFNNLAARAAVNILPPIERVRFTRRYLSQVSDDELAFSKTPEFYEMLKFPKIAQAHMSRRPLEVSFGFESSAGQYGSIRIRPKPNRFNRVIDLLKALLKAIEVSDLEFTFSISKEDVQRMIAEI